MRAVSVASKHRWYGQASATAYEVKKTMCDGMLFQCSFCVGIGRCNGGKCGRTHELYARHRLVINLMSGGSVPLRTACDIQRQKSLVLPILSCPKLAELTSAELTFAEHSLA